MGLITLYLICSKGKGGAICYSNLAVFKKTGAVFRALGVQHDGDGKIELRTDLLDAVNEHLMGLMGTVGEVEPGDIHARLTHFRQSLLVLAGRTNSTNNLRLSHVM